MSVFSRPQEAVQASKKPGTEELKAYRPKQINVQYRGSFTATEVGWGKMYLHNCSLKLFPVYRNSMLIKKLGKGRKASEGKQPTDTWVLICGWRGDIIRQRSETPCCRVDLVT